jgi:hypothetical protein
MEKKKKKERQGLPRPVGSIPLLIPNEDGKRKRKALEWVCIVCCVEGRWRVRKEFTQFRSRETDKLGVFGPAICPNAIGLEAILHIHLSGLIKSHPSLLHNLENLSLGSIIKATATVASLNIARQVKGTAGQARFDVVAKVAWKSRIYISGAGEMDIGETMKPMGASKEGDGDGDEEDEGDRVKYVAHDCAMLTSRLWSSI